MDQNKVLKRSSVEQSIVQPVNIVFVNENPPLQQYYQCATSAPNPLQQLHHPQQLHRQSLQQHQQHPRTYQRRQNPQQRYLQHHQHAQQEPKKNRLGLLEQLPQSSPQIIQQTKYPQQHIQHTEELIRYEYIERPMTLDVWTQTLNFQRHHSAVHLMKEAGLKAEIVELEEYLRVQTELINQLKLERIRPPSPPQEVPNSTTITPPTIITHQAMRYRILSNQNEDTSEGKIEIEPSDDATPTSSNMNNSGDSDRIEFCLNELSSQSQVVSEEAKRPNLANGTVSIGPNGTMIPVTVYENLNWSSASLATRKLLTTLYSRQTLATHSMTGKASPAFKGKPIKKMLDPLVVEDIIYIVSNKCGVKAKEVRAAITTKCADENKMMKLLSAKSKRPQNSKRSPLKELKVNAETQENSDVENA